MGVVRAAICAGVCSLFACASIAGLEEPQESALQEEIPSTSRGDAATGSSSSSSSSSGGGNTDAAPDGPPPCTRIPTGSTMACTAAIECCSNKCNEQKRCAEACVAELSGCSPGDDAPCCHGLFCTRFGGYCRPCVGPGGQPEALGTVNVKSCCSRMLNGANGTCL